MSNLSSICGLWSKVSKSGNKFYSGKIKESITLNAGDWINMFPVSGDKKTKGSPEFNLMVAGGTVQDNTKQEPVQQQEQSENVAF